uniref:AMP-binding enzyme C-terminal domain-containing protein n=1 Tax=Megaselia scalaris TaxID=36166 RepID=T1H0R5_MEGSC
MVPQFLAKHPIRSAEIEDAIKARIGVPTIRQGYGLSEGTLRLTVQSDERCTPGSVGVLSKELTKTKRRTLLQRRQHYERIYWRQNSTDAMIKNGWLHTGDIGYYDYDFEFFIAPPAEIEALLLTHDKIKDVAVVGKPDESAGELPFGVELTEKDIMDFVAANASSPKRLRG